MHQIWVDPESGQGGLFGDLQEDEQEALASAGLKKVLDIPTDDKVKAQEKFIEWCRTQCPDAKVIETDFSKLVR